MLVNKFWEKIWKEQVKPSDSGENLGGYGSVPHAMGNEAPLFIPANIPGLGPVPVLFAGLLPRFNSSDMVQDASLVVHLRRTGTHSHSESGHVSFPPHGTNVAPRAGHIFTKSPGLLNHIHQGPWLDIHRNFVSYVLHTLELYDEPSNEIVQLSKQWAEWNDLTSLANYRLVVQILFGYLTKSSNLNHDSSIDISNRLSADVSCVLRQMNSILSDRATYKHFLCCRGAVAQQLLDLLQDLLDSSHELTSRALFSKALLRLSGECGLHPTCFTLTGVEKMGQQVAGGGFGDIWKGSIGGQTVAVKSMRQFKNDDVNVSIKKLGREALIWRQLSHPNLLPFFGMYVLEHRLCLISPWMDNGNLKDFLNNESSGTNHVSLMVDVARGLEYLHSQDVVHGDLKPVNILVTPSGRACISDFGLSTIVDELSLKMTFSSRSGRAGTVRYQAPELLKNESSTHFGSDVYAFACVCYEILTGKVPFFEVANEASVIFKVVIEEARPSGLERISPDDLRLLLEGCWHQKAEKRPTSTAILGRLLRQPIGDEIKGSHPPDWDSTYSARFRRSIQKWPLFPSIAEVGQRIPRVSTSSPSAPPPLEQDRGQLGMPTSSSRTSSGVGPRYLSTTLTENPTFSSRHEVGAGVDRSPRPPSRLVVPVPVPRAEPVPESALITPPASRTENGEATAAQTGSSSPASSPQMFSPTPTIRRPMRRRTATPDKVLATANKVSDIDIVPPISVLIVEDNVVNQMQLAGFMRKKKLKFQVADNGLDAVEKWKTGNFDLILMDIQMPVMDGIDATKEIRRLEKLNAAEGYPPVSLASPTSATSGLSSTSPYRSVTIIALTASSLNSDRVKALAAGCNDFLTKPVNHRWLNNKVMEWGSIKALQMWADVPPPGGDSQSPLSVAKAKEVADRLHVPERGLNKRAAAKPETKTQAECGVENDQEEIALGAVPVSSGTRFLDTPSLIDDTIKVEVATDVSEGVPLDASPPSDIPSVR